MSNKSRLNAEYRSEGVTKAADPSPEVVQEREELRQEYEAWERSLWRKRIITSFFITVFSSVIVALVIYYIYGL